MRSDLIRVSTVGMTKEDWLRYRSNGVGGSEVGVVLGLSPYKSSLELFYDKLSPIHEIEENEAMHWGNALEDLIADRWQYWGTDAQSMIANFKAGNQVRKCRKVNAYLVNPSYPFLFSSLDRLITKGDKGEEGVLEIKTISGFTAKTWEQGIPPSYVVQLQTYLLVTELNYGEIAILRDGRYMDVIPFEKSEIIFKRITEKCGEFWAKVETARTLLREEGVNHYQDITRESAKEFLHRLEPAPDGSEAYETFLNKRYTSIPMAREGTLEQLEIASRYIAIAKDIEVLEENKREHSNRLKVIMGEAEELSFGASGKITWKNNVKGSRVFNVKLKQVAQN